MDKKRNTKSVVLTIIVTVIVLVILSVLGVRYLMPGYASEHNISSEGMHYKIYSIAVRLFPLLVGIVLIIIASMIAGSKDDDVDEDDLLPPNSYDSQLFEKPSDDPLTVPAPENGQIPEPVEPEVVSSDTISDEDFNAIFGNPADQKEDEEIAPVSGPVAEEAPVSGAEPVQEEAPAAPVSDNSDLVDAIYALVGKLDSLADGRDRGGDVRQSDLDALEKKVDSLCDSVARLSALVAGGLVAAPVMEEKKPEDVPAPAADTIEDPANRKINDYDPADPMDLMKIEFDCAQTDAYDITYAFTKDDADSVRNSLGDLAYVFSVRNKTIAVIPFLSDTEAQAELDGRNIRHTTVFVKGGEKAEFEKAVLPKI